MGVPKFAAWLTRKYPSLVLDRCPDNVHGLYIDLNGLIHPCCHDEHDPSVASRTHEEKLRSICLAIETLVVTVRPRHVLYIAIDGVVPRAKMNQQRARRYMSAAVPLTDEDKPIHGGSHEMSATIVAAMEKEFSQAECDSAERELADVSDALMRDMLYGGSAAIALEEDTHKEAEASTLRAAPWVTVPMPASESTKGACSTTAQVGREPAVAAPSAKFDSNCISPGTSFMDAVAAAVRGYIRHKLAPEENDGAGKARAEVRGSPAATSATCAHWADLTVVFSDSNTAGEGEHKIFDFLRTQSAFPGFNGNGCHVIAGLDADLIFLSLSLHIPHVVILRDHKRSSYEQALLPDTAGGTLVTKKVSLKADPRQVRRSAARSSSITSIGSAAAPSASAEDEAAPFSGAVFRETPSDNEKVECETAWCSGAPSSLASPTTVAPATAVPQHIADIVVEPCDSYEYFDVDVIGASVVSEVYQLCLENGMQLRGDILQCVANCVSANGFCFHCPNFTDSREAVDGTDIDRGDSGDAKTSSSATAKGDGKRRGKVDGNLKAPPAPFHPCTSTSNSKIIDDFIVLGVLLGNDFLPHLPSVYCGESAMDTLMDVYVHAVLPYGYLTGGQHEIQLLQLERLLRAYAAVEAVRFRQFAIQSGVMTPQDAATPELCSAADRRCWRDVYVRTTSLRDEAGVQAACRSYVEGMRFVWRYYSSISEQVSWTWYYPLHHAPLALDIADFLRAQGPKVQTTLMAPKLERQPPSPFCQLLCILPPTSRQLVPAALRATMVSPPAELAETFPNRWAVDRAGAYGKDHLATVLLPFANARRLQELVAAASGTYTEAERQRSALRSAHLVFERQSAELGKDSTAASTDATPTAVAAGSFTYLTASDRADSVACAKPRRASPICKAPPTAGSAAKKMRGFRIQGSGLSVLSAEEKPADMRDCAAIVCSSLVDLVPPLSRPRTYSYTVPIPSLTVLPDGSRLAAPRRPQHRRGRRRPHHRSDADPPDRNVRGYAAANNAADAQAATPAVLFGEFSLCLVAVGILTAEATLWRSLPMPSLLQSWQIFLQLCGLGAAVIWLAFALGLTVAPKGRSAGSGLHRHSAFASFADWQCCVCLSLNFARGRRCFICRAPYDPHRCVALFSSRHPPEPPLMDPDHSAYAACYSITAV
ncbi:5'-3' exonuclease, putative [Leishmania tarentolae]|uniref:5'-3' exonuclease, putative n=1 Tax=Leishmania tarentolae TaxID=5689 RepID=A0A640KF47_LEITA|nr:5'-3' exonuclease, putative [Leishmania tarentolae]